MSSSDDDDDFDRRPTPDEFPAPRVSTTDRIRHKKTHPRGTPIVMSDTDRALAGRDRRTPVTYVSEEPTLPRAMFNFDHEDYAARVAELAAQLRRAGLDPFVIGAALSIKVHDARERQETGKKELEEQLEAFLRVQPGGEKFDDLAKIVSTLQQQQLELAPVRRGLRWLQASVVLVVVGIGGWLYTRGGDEREVKLKIQMLEKDNERLGRLVERLENKGTP